MTENITEENLRELEKNSKTQQFADILWELYLVNKKIKNEELDSVYTKLALFSAQCGPFVADENIRKAFDKFFDKKNKDGLVHISW